MKTSSIFLFFFFVVGLFLCSATLTAGELPQETAKPNPRSSLDQGLSNTYVIKPGDQVDLRVWGYSEFNTVAIVNPEGKIPVPLVGEVKAAGVTETQLTEQMRLKLVEYIQGEVKLTASVTRGASTAQRITVLGAVARQDSYPTTIEVSLFEVLCIAGGMTVESDLHAVKIMSMKKKTATIVNLTGYMEVGDLDGIPKVEPGDTVFVPHRRHRARSFFSSLATVLSLSSTIASTTLLFLSLTDRI